NGWKVSFILTHPSVRVVLKRNTHHHLVIGKRKGLDIYEGLIAMDGQYIAKGQEGFILTYARRV
ncbi:MAG: hypothetical protein K8J31_18405, partial [Anaerolineae bacterium]|nr:hypothetical protein [Anaerolineae bacterium]